MGFWRFEISPNLLATLMCRIPPFDACHFLPRFCRRWKTGRTVGSGMKSSGNRSCKTFPLDLMFSCFAFCNTFRIYQLWFLLFSTGDINLRQLNPDLIALIYASILHFVGRMWINWVFQQKFTLNNLDLGICCLNWIFIYIYTYICSFGLSPKSLQKSSMDQKGSRLPRRLHHGKFSGNSRRSSCRCDFRCFASCRAIHRFRWQRRRGLGGEGQMFFLNSGS